ncbi:Bud-site selection protein [Mycena sp. CBHHK59/15]|nr:Bud-site selection protein [Mycena sp. CBHHK59/15]
MDASSAPRGTKRKRPEPAKEDPARKLAGKLHHDMKDVRKAAKKARTFETQRLVKKLKGLRARPNASEPEIRTIEAELAELKTIDHDALAHTALRTRLLKDKRLAAAVLLDELTLHLAPSPATAKLHARLLSAKALAAGVQAAMDDLRAALLPKPGADAEEGQRPVKSTRVEGDGDGENEDEDEDEESEEDEEEDDDGDELAQPQDDTGWESGSVGDNDEDEDEDGDADGWESGSVDSNPAPAVKPSTTSKTAKSITVTKSTTVAKTTKTPVAAKPTASAPSLSTFLPSLAVGFVRGGSSDSDVDDADEVDVDPRKNRRGQRARRACVFPLTLSFIFVFCDLSVPSFFPRASSLHPSLPNKLNSLI